MEKSLTDENFEQQINSTDKLVLVDFFATWCDPCALLAPILEKVVDGFEGKIILLKANLDNIPVTAKKFGIERIPTIIVFKNGKQVSGFVGLMPKNKIKEWLDNLLSNG